MEYKYLLPYLLWKARHWLQSCITWMQEIKVTRKTTVRRLQTGWPGAWGLTIGTSRDYSLLHSVQNRRGWQTCWSAKGADIPRVMRLGREVLHSTLSSADLNTLIWLFARPVSKLKVPGIRSLSDVMNYTLITSYVDQKTGNVLRLNNDHWRCAQFRNDSQNVDVLHFTQGYKNNISGI